MKIKITLTEGMLGTASANPEVEVPAGTTFECEITTLDKHLDALMVKCLDYGANKGIGQWRNSGKGRFVWEEIL